MKAPKPEDQGLSPHQFPDLNRRFYDSGSTPHAFVRQRVRALLLAGSRDVHILEAQRGIRFGRFFVAGFPEDDPLLEEPSVNTFVMTESAVLFHHAAESLVRLVLAHLDEPECPWLEMRRLTTRSYNDRRDQLLAALTEDKTLQALMKVFYGIDRSAAGPLEEVWPSLEQAVVEFLHHALTTLRSDADLYNAAKHGLAIAGGEDRLRLLEGAEEEGAGSVPDEERMLLRADGQCLSYLHRGDAPPPRWMMTTTWANAEENLALTMLASRFISNLWGVARARLLRDQGNVVVEAISANDLRAIHRIVGRRDGFDHIEVATYLRYEGDQGMSGRISFTTPSAGEHAPPQEQQSEMGENPH